MNKVVICQEYENYAFEDHTTWHTLMCRHELLNKNLICREYLDGLQALQLSSAKIVDIISLSKHLENINGWTLVPVAGLISTRDFFYMLINKRYPVTVSIRKPSEIEFSEQPDLFHDVCGHLPLLINEKFTRFLTSYSVIAIKYVNNDRAIEMLGRLYWYTFEMGAIKQDDQIKAFGGALLTSAEEIRNLLSDEIPKFHFDLKQIFNTPYNPYRLQSEYFFVHSFDELFESINHMESDLQQFLFFANEDLVLRNYQVNTNLGIGFNNAIGFLNDVQFRFKEAISFVAGQPDERFFDLRDSVSRLEQFVRFKGDDNELDQNFNKIGQYGPTKGIINDLVSKYLKKDENINIAPNNILITVGAQEAFAIIVGTLCNRDQDMILIEDPCYIGLSSFAKVFGYSVNGVPIDEDGLNLKQLRETLIQLNRKGKKVKFIYVIPDYQNPTGSCMPVGNRIKLLELAYQYNFLIVEDSVYNSFTYQQKKNPTLKSLDKYNRVIYVGSFSKSIFPGLRVGIIAADQMIENENGHSCALIDEMSKVKAQITNNTSTISQGILGGVLLENDFSLQDISKAKFQSYKQKRDRMIECLNMYFDKSESWTNGIDWLDPAGGFFIKMSLPCEFDLNDVAECAENFGIIVCPMRFFYLAEGGENEIRLTFSNISLDEIGEGVARLSKYLYTKIMRTGNLSYNKIASANY